MKKNNAALAQRILPLIDLTNLNENATVADIKKLCQQAKNPHGNVAAVCVYPKFISLAKELLKNTFIKITTVGNFPHGTTTLGSVLNEIETAKKLGANEFDIVMPYQKYLAGETADVINFVTHCKKTCGNSILKIILETGALQQPTIIAEASHDVILAGADFIKTSTGKISEGATLAAAKMMLQTIHNLQLNRIVGFKASGGIRTLAQAETYLQLADKIMGLHWVSPMTFRFGTSSLLNKIPKK